MGDWVTANKGAGPWAFEEQAEKSGYVNNPRWTVTPADEKMHEPCGYWRKTRPAIPALVNVYALVQNEGFWAAYFNESSLVYTGHYVHQNSNLYGPVRYENSLIMTVGVGSPTPIPTIERVSIDPPFVIQETYAPFVANDLTDKIPFNWGPGLVDGKYYVLQGSLVTGITPGVYNGANFVRLSSTLQREARGYWCTVVTGTDGNLYASKTTLTPTDTAWEDARRPITGGSWSSDWKLLADMVIDSPITPWGIGHVYSGACGAVDWTYGGGYIYLVSSGAPNIGIRKIDPMTFAILATNGAEANPYDTSYGGTHPVVHNGIIYVIYSTLLGSYPPSNPTNVRAYSATTLQLLTTGPTLLVGYGDIPRSGLLADPNYLICWINTGDGSWKLYKLDYTSLAVVASQDIILPSDGPYPPNVMELQSYKDYWLMFYYRGIGVIDAASMTLVDHIDLIPQGWLTNMNLDHALGTEVRGATPDPITSTQPVWTMPS